MAVRRRLTASNRATRLGPPPNGSSVNWQVSGVPIPGTGGTVTEPQSIPNFCELPLHRRTQMQCGTAATPNSDPALTRNVTWAPWNNGVGLAVVRTPGQIDVVEGLGANVDVTGRRLGSKLRRHLRFTMPFLTFTTAYSLIGNAATMAAPRGGSLHAHTRTRETVLHNLGGVPWRYWRIRHGFVATATDQNAQPRPHTPPTGAQPLRGVTSQVTYINVLQQSAPADDFQVAPFHVVRTGDSQPVRNASGLPAPTLLWQTRPANSTGAGPTDRHRRHYRDYTTAATALADNGEQYRVVATNALGSTREPGGHGVSQRSRCRAEHHHAASQPQRDLRQRRCVRHRWPALKH